MTVHDRRGIPAGDKHIRNSAPGARRVVRHRPVAATEFTACRLCETEIDMPGSPHPSTLRVSIVLGMEIIMRRTALLGSLALAAALSLAPSGAALAQTGPEVTVAPTGTFSTQTGAATLSGTYSCGDNSGFAFIEVVLSQNVGRVSTVSGSAFAEIPPCSPGVTGTWTATVGPTNGQFRGGNTSASARLLVDGSAAAETGATVRLHG